MNEEHVEAIRADPNRRCRKLEVLSVTGHFWGGTCELAFHGVLFERAGFELVVVRFDFEEWDDGVCTVLKTQ